MWGGCGAGGGFHAEHNSAWAHEAVKRDEREKEKLMHGIADPLTKLSLCTHRGAASTTRSVRERGDAAGRRDRARLTRRTRLCKASHVRRLFTRSFSLGKTWNGAPAWSQIRCSPPGAQHERAKLNRAACYVAGWSDCAAPAAAVPAPSGRCCKTVSASDIQFVAPFRVFLWNLQRCCVALLLTNSGKIMQVAAEYILSHDSYSN